MPLISCEFIPILTWYENCVISSATGTSKFAIIDTKIYFPVVTLSTRDQIKQLEQLESDIKRIINWKKCQSKLTEKTKNRHLDYLIDPSFQELNRLFVLSFENRTDREVPTGYFIPKVEIKGYNVMIDRRKFFVQPIKNNWITYENIWKIAAGQGKDCTTGCLLDYIYFKNHL